MRTANEIAEWIVRYSAGDLGAPVDPMSLEKLTYYSQAFYLALFDEPLFADEIQAWKWGPVIPPVYKRYQAFGGSPILIEEEGASEVGEQVEVFLSQIVGFFQRYTASTLSRATHVEEPWAYASKTDDNVIRQIDIRAYYRSLMDEGEIALSRHELLDTIPEPRWSSFYLAGICSRKLSAHPFYSAGLAAKLSAQVPRRTPLPEDFFAPVNRDDLVEFSRNEDPSETIKRALS